MINIEQLRQAQYTLEKYRSGKANLDNNLIESEDWWKLRHYRDFKSIKYMRDPETGKVAIAGDSVTIKRQSSWMFNSIMNKHADLMDNYPDPVIMARAKDDEEVAKVLSSVVPVIMENCKFEGVYSDNSWNKLTQGTAIYSVVWDKDKLNGLGDIDIGIVDMLSIYWEPGVQDIQDSQNIFVLSLIDKKIIEETYPQAKGNLTGTSLVDKQYNYDDHVDTADKAIVVDWYYKLSEGNRTVLHYCKWVDDVVLYDSTTDPQCANGFYAHGKYPFVMDPLYREKGTPAGFGYVDIMRSTQEDIDDMRAAFRKNSAWGAKPRYFANDGSDVNLQEFRNLDQEIVHVSGDLSENRLRLIDTKPLDSSYLNLYQMSIDELKETSGNRDFSQGSTAGGVTSGAAIAALQEAGSKGSRDMIKGSYRAYSEICELVIELIRQFYTLPRTFRITGETGQPEYVEFDNEGMTPQQTMIAGEIFQKEPVFDIIVKAQRSNPYSRLSQNELAFSLYDRGFFNPELADQAMAALDIMDFEGKEKVEEKVQQNGLMFQQIQQMQQSMIQMASLLAETTGDTRILDALTAQQGGAPQVSTGGGIPQVDAMGEPMMGNSIASQRRRQAATSTEVK